jgi:hypothetical protein
MSSTSSWQERSSPRSRRHLRVEVALERGAHLGARAVQEDPLVAVGDAECVADLVGPQPSTSRRRITWRWRAGSASIASRASCSVSRPSRHSSGSSSQRWGAAAQ